MILFTSAGVCGELGTTDVGASGCGGDEHALPILVLCVPFLGTRCETEMIANPFLTLPGVEAFENKSILGRLLCQKDRQREKIQ